MRWRKDRRDVRRPRLRPSECTRGVAAALIVVVSVVGAMVLPAAATAAPLTPLVSLTTGEPFSSGQLIDVNVAPNRILQPGASLTIEECAAPAQRLPHGQLVCDHRTRQHGRVIANRDGSVLYPGFPVYALPDALTLHEWAGLHEVAGDRPVCDLTHACVLVISGGDGDRDSDDGGGSVWSDPFFIGPSVADPPSSTPEVPYVLALPLLAAAIVGGTVLVRRRRSGSPSPE
jgi:hypothetical protein